MINSKGGAMNGKATWNQGKNPHGGIFDQGNPRSRSKKDPTEEDLARGRARRKREDYEEKLELKKMIGEALGYE